MNGIDTIIKELLENDNKLLTGQVTLEENNPFDEMVKQARNFMSKLDGSQVDVALNPSPKGMFVPALADETLELMDKYLTVSPLGPLREATAKDKSKSTGSPGSVVSADSCGPKGPSRNAELRNQLSNDHSVCKITFEMVPHESNLLFRVKSVHNVLPFEELPDIYRYGNVAFYTVKRSPDNGKELCIRTNLRTKWLVIGSSLFDGSDLKWIISTMKAAGNALVAARKEIAEVQKKAGRTFEIVI